MLDLIYVYNIENIDEVINRLNINIEKDTIIPYQYRGVCSEMFWPMDCINRYVYYSNILSELLAKFEYHRKRAQEYEDKFSYAPQVTGISIFDKEKMKYTYLAGGAEIKTLGDIIEQVKEDGLPIPTILQKEYDNIT